MTPVGPDPPSGRRDRGDHPAAASPRPRHRRACGQERQQECFLVVTHDRTKSTPALQRAYPWQDYALAVEMADETNVELDLHAAVRQRLRARLPT